MDAATGWSLGLWFVFGLVPVLGDSIGWDKVLDQTVTAWVQAVGSIGAIYAAVAIASSQNKRAERERWAASAAPIEVRAQILKSLSRQALNLIPPQCRSEELDWLTYAARWEATKAQAIARVRELAGAFETIQLTSSGTAMELVTLVQGKYRVRELLQAIEDAKVAQSALGRIEEIALNLSEYAEDLSALARSVREKGPA